MWLSGPGGLAGALCTVPQWIAKQQLARQGTKCFWREPAVGQQKSAQRHIKAESGFATGY
eukprot:COSAG01_NODE_434_length_17079_cov_11.829270_1_plen_60_part_00